ncbi:MAG: metallophosphoesterase family protein [Candidatus Odinarchaeota archaeon]
MGDSRISYDIITEIIIDGFSMNIAILSDIHGNDCALNAVISDIKSLNISEIVFLGDLVINGPSPSEVFQELRNLKPLCWIKGNTDGWFAEIDDEWSPSTKKEEKLYNAYIYARNHLKKESIDFLLRTPEKCVFEAIGIPILALHGSPRSISEGIGKNISHSELKEIFSNIEESIIVSGHSHVPFIVKIANKTIFNVGSIGMSLDGDNRASYGIIKIKNQIPKCSIRRVTYPISKTIEIARNREFPDLINYKKILREARISQ